MRPCAVVPVAVPVAVLVAVQVAVPVAVPVAVAAHGASLHTGRLSRRRHGGLVAASLDLAGCGARPPAWRGAPRTAGRCMTSRSSRSKRWKRRRWSVTAVVVASPSRRQLARPCPCPSRLRRGIVRPAFLPFLWRPGPRPMPQLARRHGARGSRRGLRRVSVAFRCSGAFPASRLAVVQTRSVAGRVSARLGAWLGLCVRVRLAQRRTRSGTRSATAGSTPCSKHQARCGRSAAPANERAHTRSAACG